MTGLVSRVLYALAQQSSIFTARYRAVQAKRLCHHETDGQPAIKEYQGVASDRVYSGPALPWARVSSYLAFPSLPSIDGGLFLLHFPGGRPRRTLSVILPCDARTFLTVIPFGTIPRDCPAQSRVLYPKERKKSSFFGQKRLLFTKSGDFFRLK